MTSQALIRRLRAHAGRSLVGGKGLTVYTSTGELAPAVMWYILASQKHKRPLKTRDMDVLGATEK